MCQYNHKNLSALKTTQSDQLQNQKCDNAS